VKQQKEIIEERNEKMNSNIVMINKFINLEHKKKILDSQLQREWIPRVSKKDENVDM